MRWIVVGAGAAGAVVAARLSETTTNHVTVIERGGDVTVATTDAAVRGLDLLSALGSSHVDDTQRVRRRSNGRPEPYLTGRGVGGSGLVNGMLMERGDDAQYRAWGWDDTDAAFEAVAVPSSRVYDRWLAPFDEALLSAEPTARRARLATDGRQRVTSADAYLGPARRRPNLAIRPESGVRRLLMDDRRAAGVVLDDGTIIEADGVVLCAGALASPAILLRSAEWDVPIGVGVQDHPSATITLRWASPELERSPAGHGEAPCAEDGGDGDPLTGCAEPLVATGVLAGDDVLQIVPLRATGSDEVGRRHGALTVGLLRPRSRGAVTVDAAGKVDVELNELAEPEDLALLTSGVERLSRLVSTPQIARLIDGRPDGDAVTVGEGVPLSSFETHDAIAEQLLTGAVGGAYLHAAASCPMGKVVDGDCRVFGTSNLYVVDASVFPQVPAAPTYLPTLMLAERTAVRLRHLSSTGT